MHTLNNSPIKAYRILNVPDGDISLTGDGLSPGWRRATVLNDFAYPWEDDAPLPTTFMSVHDNHWVYFHFNVADVRVHVDVISNDKLEVIDSSRVEIFLRKDQQMSPYFCLEIDAHGRVLDYQGYFHRKFDFNWSWPSDALKVASSRHAKGYVVEFAISKASLRSLGLLSDASDILQAGLFRADCTETVTAREHMRWISWMRPDSATPDFHIPSAFGVLRLC